jgi:hypothetical protein
MPRTVVPRTLDADSPAADLAGAGAGGGKGDGLPEKLVKYVPAESLAFFVPISAAIGTSDEAWLIAVAIVALLGTPLYLWVAAPSGPTAPRPHFYLLAVIAFACWALGTSGSIQSLVGIGQTLGGVVLGIGAFAIPLIDAALEKLKVRF